MRNDFNIDINNSLAFINIDIWLIKINMCYAFININKWFSDIIKSLININK